MAIYHHIGVIVLAGGKSSRMGQDKGFYPLGDKPMIAHVLDTAKKITDAILIVANDDRYNQIGFPVIADEYREKGPLAGLYTGIKNSTFEYNLVLTCDVPYLHEGVLEFLIDSSTGYDITLAESEGRQHPLIAVYRKSCLPVIEKNLDENNLKITALFDHLKVRMVDMVDFLPENFRNINSPGDL